MATNSGQVNLDKLETDLRSPGSATGLRLGESREEAISLIDVLRTIELRTTEYRKAAEKLTHEWATDLQRIVGSLSSH